MTDHLGLEARVRLTTAVHTLTVAAEHGDEAFTACLRLLVNEWQWLDPVDLAATAALAAAVLANVLTVTGHDAQRGTDVAAGLVVDAFKAATE